MSDLHGRTPKDVIGGRLVGVTAEDGPVGEIVALADAVYDFLAENKDLSTVEIAREQARGRALVQVLVILLQGEHSGETVRWMLEHRRAAREAAEDG